MLPPLDSDLKDARRYLPAGTPEEQEAFAERQIRARQRMYRLRRFYRDYPCRMARIHLLTGSAIMIGRFCGFSRSFEAIGEAVSPVDADGAPRTEAWQAYREACAARRPWQICEARWLAAHMQDMEAVRAAGLDAGFYREADAHPNDPTWRLLRQHLEVTVGQRLMESAALDGAVAYETAMARTMTLSVWRLLTTGRSLLGRYAWEGLRALFLSPREPPRPLMGYRRCALELLRLSMTAWSAARVYRRGVRERERGSQSREDGWPLLEQVLGARVREVHPLIVRFYTNPARFDVKASLKLHTIPARLFSRLLTTLLGQGLYESDIEEMEASLRVFRRADGSMHFLREIYCGDTLRVFDSDFVVRTVGGTPTLFEVFVDLKTDIAFDVTPLPGGGVSISIRHFYLRGVRLPTLGFRVAFQSRVLTAEDGAESLQVDGHLLLRPRTALGRFLAYRVLRRPEHLADIHYWAWPSGH